MLKNTNFSKLIVTRFLTLMALGFSLYLLVGTQSTTVAMTINDDLDGEGIVNADDSCPDTGEGLEDNFKRALNCFLGNRV